MAPHPSTLAWKIPCHGQRSLAGCSSWDRKESDMTERLRHTHTNTHLAVILIYLFQMANDAEHFLMS